MVKDEIERDMLDFTTCMHLFSNASLIRRQHYESVEILDECLWEVYYQRQTQDVECLFGIAKRSWRSWTNAAMSSSLLTVTTIVDSLGLKALQPRLFVEMFAWHLVHWL